MINQKLVTRLNLDLDKRPNLIYKSYIARNILANSFSPFTNYYYCYNLKTLVLADEKNLILELIQENLIKDFI